MNNNDHHRFAMQIASELDGETIKGDLKVRCPKCQGSKKKKYARMILGTDNTYFLQCPACKQHMSVQTLIKDYGSPDLKTDWSNAWKEFFRSRTTPRATKENPFERPMPLKNRRRRKMV